MPEICRFFGIVIAIEPPGLFRGRLSPRALALVVEWAALHQQELLEAWEQRTAGGRIRRIEPLR